MAAVAAAALAVGALAACGAGRTDTGGSSGSNGGSSSGKAITIGTTDKVVALDPAGSYDSGSTLLETQLYQFLLIPEAGSTTPAPDAAQSCSFTAATTYTCVMKPNLKFSNGDPLTANDVAFSYNRIVKINNPNGPASLLSNMKSVSAPDSTHVVFTLNNGNDQTWPFVLGTSAGPIVDSKVFPATSLLDDAKVIGSGPYKLGSYQKNQLVQLQPNTNYGGDQKLANAGATLRYYTQANAMKLDIQSGNIDVAWRQLAPSDVDSLSKASGVKVDTGPGGEIRYLVYNFRTMAGGTDAQKKAIRQAVAESIDRQQIATDVYKDTYQPLYSMVADGLVGHIDSFKTAYGTSPDKSKATSTLQSAGVSTPVTLNIEYTTDHYGPSSDDEYNEIKRQLEGTGLFKVNLQSTDFDTYSANRVKDAYPEYQLGWFPDFSDADNYLSPFLVPNNFVSAHYCDQNATNRPCDTDGVAPLLKTEQTSSGSARTDAIEKLQTIEATGEMPYLPLLQGKQVAVDRTDITGVASTLDPSFLFRFWKIGKS